MANYHYTAILEIVQVQATGTVSSPSKDKSEVARIVVRADNLEELKRKVAKHVELV